VFKDTYYDFLNTIQSQIQTYKGPTRIMTLNNQIPKPNKGNGKVDLASNRIHLIDKVHNQKHVHCTMWLKKVLIEMDHPTSYSQHVVNEMKHDASKFLT